MDDKNTGWGDVAPWYDDLLETGSNYQKDVILPDLLGVLNIQKGDRILDLACGQGFFARAFRAAGAKVIGVDVAHELIDIAKNYEKEGLNTKSVANLPLARERAGLVFSPDGIVIDYFVAPSHKLEFIPNESMDKITIVLALQNIEKVSETFKECFRVLRSGGALVMVMNHPAFRVPRESSWGFDEKNEIQYRRVDKYMSELKVSINMHPGEKSPSFTSTFHRPVQFYFKALKGAGFLVRNLHELLSNKVSQPGKRVHAENQARKEIPLFMTIEAVK